MSNKRLTRSRQHNIIAGVMGGIADYLGWSPFKVRLLFVIVSCVSVAVPGILVYLILYLYLRFFLMRFLKHHEPRSLIREYLHFFGVHMKAIRKTKYNLRDYQI